MSTVTIPKHIYWSCREKPSIDTNDPAQKKWFLEQTLTHGTMTDIRALDLEDVKRELAGLRLPRHVKTLWRNYFGRGDTDPVPSEGS